MVYSAEGIPKKCRGTGATTMRNSTRLSCTAMFQATQVIPLAQVTNRGDYVFSLLQDLMMLTSSLRQQPAADNLTQ